MNDVISKNIIRNNATSMVQFLQNYLAIETVFPNPQYDKAVTLLREQATADGFSSQVVPLSSGFPALIITYEGSDSSLPSLVLNHHMDVVPAHHTSEWITPPFAGELRDGMIIGRGTQDMKGVGVVHYFALKALKEAGIRPHRTIHILAVPDEERGGFGGTGLLIHTEAFKKLNVGYILDEGCPSGDPSFLYLKVDERKPFQVRITAQGEQAHGSALRAQNATHDLIQFLQRVVSYHNEQKSLLSSNDPRSLASSGNLVSGNLVSPGDLLSMHITSFQSGASHDGIVALNVIPGEATATIDIRVPPTRTLAEVRSTLLSELKQFPSLSFSLEATVEERIPRSHHETTLYKAVTESIRNQGLNPQPHITEGASDLRFHLAQGIDGIGLSPFTCKNNLHSTNEAVPLSDMIQGVQLFTQLLQRMCVFREP